MSKTRLKDIALTSFSNYDFCNELNISKDLSVALNELLNNKNIIIQKSDKGNSVVVINKSDYLEKVELILSDESKFGKLNVDPDIYLNVIIVQQNKISTFLKKVKAKGSIDAILYKKLQPVGSKPGTLYGLCKVHKQKIGPCPPFHPILSAIQTTTYGLAKHLVSILTPQ